MKIPIYAITIIFSFISFTCEECSQQNNDESNEFVLFDFDNTDSLEVSKMNDVSYKIVSSENNKKLLINSGYNITKPTLTLLEPEEVDWDLNGYYQVKADITNVGEDYMQAEMFVGDDPDGLIKWYCSDYVDLNPGETKTITVDLAWTPWIFSPQLDIKGMRGIPGALKTDIDAIREITFCSRYACTNNQFTVDNIRAVGQLEIRDTTGFFPFVDEFGQYKHKEWIGKVNSVSDLKKQYIVQARRLSNDPEPKSRGRYGGWTKGPKLEATGFFRTEKYDGNWWMVDPEGYLFWTAGVNCVSPSSVPTGITGREHYFEWLPIENAEYADFFGTRGRASHGIYSKYDSYTYFNFYKSNLYRVHGQDWLVKFSDLAHKRFKSWGLNTIGFVSEKHTISQQRTPYVGSIWIRNTPKIQGSEGFWGKFHDVFDPQFREIVKKSMEEQKYGAGDPWCIGYFVDNELAWGAKGSLALGALRSPSDQPAKQEFVKDLRTKYSSIEKLNSAWETSFSSWDDLLNSTTIPENLEVNDDILEFYGKISDTYFRILKEELKRIAPNQNYLGCRFAWANNDIVLTAASKYMDIMSFNKYEYSVENVGLPKGIDKPIMIGEFHFGALDRGSYHVGVKKAESQEDRGQKYQDYIQGALRNKLIVGAHWFQYLDEPLTGRFDGENYNVGLIDICDNPYDELVDKIKETTYEMYEYRINN